QTRGHWCGQRWRVGHPRALRNDESIGLAVRSIPLCEQSVQSLSLRAHGPLQTWWLHCGPLRRVEWEFRQSLPLEWPREVESDLFPLRVHADGGYPGSRDVHVSEG